MRRSTAVLSSWLPPLLWCGLIFYLSSIPSLGTGWGIWDFILRKIAHMVEFGVLVLLVARALRRTWSALAPAGVTALASAFSVLYAASDEFHQMFVPGRGPSVKDVVIDACGVALALLLSRRMARLRRGRILASAKSLAVLLVAVSLLSGCGPDAAFKRAKGAEAHGRPYEAWQKYQAFAARFPDHKAAPEALFRAGWLAQTTLGDCDAARAFYERIEKKYPSSDPWADEAKFFSDNCPDYFPLVAKTTWVEGDSDTGGKNARIESTCEVSSAPARIPFSSAVVTRSYFAGSSKFKTIDVLYRKDGATVWEHPIGGEAPRIILKAPFEAGTAWNAQVGGRSYNYEILSTTRTVTVGAGTFERCLLIRGRAEGVPGATNEYYAPSVGRVLTSFTTEKGERRNTELLSFTPGAEGKPYK